MNFKLSREIIILGILTVLFFYKLILHPTQMIYPSYDLQYTYSFLRIFFVDSVKSYGQIPLWNPLVFGGEPFLASSQSAIFYPLNLLYFLVSSDLVFGYMFMLDIFLLGTFTYFFAREIKLDKFSAIIASITMMFSGNITSKILAGHIVIMDGIIWFPLLMYLYEKTINTKRFIFIIFSSIPISLMLFSGNVQIALYALLTASLYVIFRTKFNFFKALSILSISVLIGFSISAIQIIPTLEFSKFSVRSSGLSYQWASDFSFHPYQWLTLFLPHFFGYPLITNTYWGINGNFWELCGYIGIFPIVLGIIAILLKRNKYILFFSILAIFAIFFAAGRFSFVYPLFYKFVPGFNLFRAPARFLFIYSFSIAILAAFGCNILVSKLTKKNTKIIKIISSGLCIIAVLSFLIFILITINKVDIGKILQAHGYAIGNNIQEIVRLIKKDIVLFSILSFSSAILLFLRVKNILNIFAIKFLIIIIIIFNLWFFGLKFYETKSIKDVFKKTPEINIFKNDNSIYRVFDLDGKLLSLPGRNNIQSLTGFESLYLTYYRDFLWQVGNHSDTPYETLFSIYDIKNYEILKLLNVKYIISNKKLSDPNIQKLQNIDSLYMIKNTRPRAYIDYPHGFQEIKIDKYSPNQIKLHTSLPQQGLLVLSEIWYPGWRAFDNGKELTINKTHSIFRSVNLNKGKHRVEFIFDPDTYKVGKIISILSIIFVIAYFIFYKLSQESRRQQ